MNITIVCIGKLKERFWTEAVEEYAKRLSRFCSFSVEELKEERLPDRASGAQEVNVKESEGKAILKRLKPDAYVIALDVLGKAVSSEAFSAKIEQLGLDGKSDIVFIIGGSLGLSPAVLARADERVSSSAMTFPHQLMRVILAEQIYRAFKIMKGETYHK